MPSPYSVNPHAVEFFVSDKDKHDNPVDPQAVVKLLSAEIAKAFGGLHKRTEESLWVDREGKLILENIIILESSFDVSKLPNLVGLVATFTLLVAGALNQAELAVIMDGKLVRISTDHDPAVNRMPFMSHMQTSSDHRTSVAKKNGT